MDQTFEKLLEKFWNWRLTNAPEFATSIGNHERDSELDDHSFTAYSKTLQDAKEFLTELEKIDSDQLNKDNKLNLELFRQQLATFVNGSTYNCNLFPINFLEGPHLEFSRTISWMKQQKYSDFEKILCRYDKFPKQAEQFIELMKKGVETGYVNPKVSMEAVPTQIKTLLETPVQESRFFEPFKELPSGFSKEESDSLQEQAFKAINEKLYPAFNNILNYIKESYLPVCRNNISCGALPSGDAFYEAALRFHISTDMTADEVHEVGTREVDRIKGRMHEVMKDVDFKGTLGDFLQFLRSDPQFYFDKKDEFLASYDEICKSIETLLPEYFNTIPKAKYVIKETPAEAAPRAPGAFYQFGSEDGSRPATFYVNTYKFETRPNYASRALSLHEAIPGHHFQVSIGIEQKNLPSFRRFFQDRQYYAAPYRFPLDTAYLEGWGLYSEYMGEEMKFYKTPYDLFGRLSFEMFRACRLVVDTGMHKKGWSRQDAIQYLTENTGLSVQDITNEVDRYITWPGQACAYKIGEIKIRELREKAQSELGEKFDLKLFHDAVLLQSALPLKVLERIVDQFIEDHK